MSTRSSPLGWTTVPSTCRWRPAERSRSVFEPSLAHGGWPSRRVLHALRFTRSPWPPSSCLPSGGSILVFSNRSSGPGGVPPASVAPRQARRRRRPPGHQPTPELLDTSSWISYPSDRYGFTIAHPEDWVENPAERNWTFPDDAKTWEHLEAADTFNNPAGSIGFSAWSWPVAQGTTLEGWMEEYCVATGGSACSAVADRAVPQVTGDGLPGLGLFGPGTDTMAFFLDGDVVYVTAIWRGETDPVVAPYGGAHRLLESFLSTMRLEGPPASGPPASAPPSSAAP